MTVMVTGGGGLLGSRIVNKLLQRGEKVVSFDTTVDQARLQAQETNPLLKRVAGDIRAYDQLSARLREFSVGRIIHMAAVLAPVTEKEPAIDYRLPPFEQSILAHINEARAERQMPLLG